MDHNSSYYNVPISTTNLDRAIICSCGICKKYVLLVAPPDGVSNGARAVSNGASTSTRKTVSSTLPFIELKRYPPSSSSSQPNPSSTPSSTPKPNTTSNSKTKTKTKTKTKVAPKSLDKISDRVEARKKYTAHIQSIIDKINSLEDDDNFDVLIAKMDYSLVPEDDIVVPIFDKTINKLFSLLVDKASPMLLMIILKKNNLLSLYKIACRVAIDKNEKNLFVQLLPLIGEKESVVEKWQLLIVTGDSEELRDIVGYNSAVICYLLNYREKAVSLVKDKKIVTPCIIKATLVATEREDLDFISLLSENCDIKQRAIVHNKLTKLEEPESTLKYFSS